MATNDIWPGLFIGDSTAQQNHTHQYFLQPEYDIPQSSNTFLWKTTPVDDAIKNLLVQVAEKVLPYLKGDDFENMLALMIELGYSALDKEEAMEKHLGDELFDL